MRAVQNLRISDSPAASAALPTPPLPTMENSKRQPRPKQQARRCLKTVWDNYVVSIARPVCTVAQSDRSVVAGTRAGSTLLSANFAFGTPPRTGEVWKEWQGYEDARKVYRAEVSVRKFEETKKVASGRTRYGQNNGKS